MELKEELFCVRVPFRPELVVSFLYFTTWNLKRMLLLIKPALKTILHLKANGFVRLGCKEQVLPLAIWRLYPLLVSRHESVSWHDTLHNLGVVNLEEQALLVCVRVSLLGNCRKEVVNQFILYPQPGTYLCSQAFQF